MLRRIYLTVPFLALLILSIYSLFIEPNNIEVVRLDLGGEEKIALISDLHIRTYGIKEKRVVEILRKEKPRVILIAGDLAEDKRYIGVLQTFLNDLSKIADVLIVYGNHDYSGGVYKALKDTDKIHIINNKIYSINGICIIGLDYINPDISLIEKARNCSKIIIMYHAPKIVKILEDNKIWLGDKDSIILVGHTHGGQVRIPTPKLRSIYLPSGSLGYCCGMYEIKELGTKMYVTKGVGTWSLVPIRFLCRPEVVIMKI